jgi:fluoride exporter
MIPWLLVAAGGAIGALLRYGVGKGATAVGLTSMWGTLGVNLIGSFLIGVVIFGSESQGWFGEKTRLFLTVGVLGAFTTMSTFSYESFQMLESKQYYSFALYFVGTIVLALAGVYLARLLIVQGLR